MINRGEDATLSSVGIFETDQRVKRIHTRLSGGGKDENVIPVGVLEF